MKIAYFIGTLKKGDGAARVLLALIKEAQKRGNESIIVTGWAGDVDASFVPVIQVPSVVFPLYREYYLSSPGISGFEKQLDEFKPDIIHLHSPDTIALAAIKYAKKRNIPIMATYHTEFGKYLSYYHLSFLKPLTWLMLRQIYKRLNLVTTPAEVVTQDLISHGIKNTRTLPWGVDPDRFNVSFRSQEWRDKILNGKNKSILFCVCRLTWEKDLRTLAAIYKLLRKNRDDFEMVIAGDGPARKELELLMPGAIFLGHVEGQELSLAYASSDIFLFPSTTETFGMVTIEAMISGLVPVVADAGGSRSLIVNGKNGFLTRPKDSLDAYKKVSILLDNPDLKERMQKASLEFARKMTWEKVFDNILEIYNQLIGNKSE